MTNQFSIPSSSEFKDEPVAYKYLLPLYAVLFGSDQFEIPVHFSGSVEIDNDLQINSTLRIVSWDISESGLDLVFKDGLDQEVIRFRDAADGSPQLAVTGAARVAGNFATTGNATVSGDLTVDGQGNIKGNVTLGDAVSDTVTTAGDTTIGRDLTINGQGNIKGNVTLGDAITDTVLASGPVTMNSTLNVKGDVTMGDSASDSVHIVGDLAVDVDVLVSGELEVQGNVLFGNSSSDVVTITGDLSVGDDTTMSGDLTGTSGVFDWQNSGNSRLKINSTGVGFFGSTPIAKPTVVGSRAGNAALNNLLSELANLGLITNSTTA